MSVTVRERQSKGELLEMFGGSIEELAAIVGNKPTSIEKNLGDPVPNSWYKRLGWDIEFPDGKGKQEARPQFIDGEPPPDGREQEQRPRPPSGARIEAPPAPVVVDYSKVAEWIAGLYSGGSRYLLGPEHELTAIVSRQSGNLGKAWAKYIEQNPRLAAWLERMMVTTPLGEVIAVHVAIGFGYYFARDAERKRIAAADAAAADDNGARDFLRPESAPFDPLV